MNKSRLTLGDLLDHRDLGLRLATGGGEARGRPVRGAHSIEIPTPTRWVPRDWVMLTSGLRLRGRPDEQRRLVAELDAGGQAALGWAAGIVTRHVPKALVDEARKRGFPVFVVPLETAFHQVVSFLGQAAAHDDVYLLRRVAAMEDHLLAALGTAHPEQAVVQRLAALLDTDVRLTTATDADPDAELVPVGRHRVLALGPSTEAHDQVAAPLVHRAVQLLELLARRDARVAAANRTHGEALLRRCLRGPADPPVLDAEAAALGVDVSLGAHAVVWQGEGTADAARDLLDGAGIAHLLLPDGDGPGAVGLVVASDGVLVELFAGQAGLVTGVGDRLDTLRDLRSSLAGAYTTVLTHRRGEHVATVARLTPTARAVAVAAASGHGLADLRRAIDPLRTKPHLMATLRCWLAVDCDANAAAARLHVHRNSLRYRLTRIGTLTGLSPTTSAAAADLRVALLADDLHALLEWGRPVVGTATVT